MDRTVAVVIGALALTGCRFDESGVGGSDGNVGLPDASTIDGSMPPDAPPGTPDASTTDASPFDAGPCQPWDWSPTNVDECDPLLPAPSRGLDLSGVASYTFDTDNATLGGPGAPSFLPGAVLSQSGGPDVRVVVLTSLDIGSLVELQITGSLPVVFLVWGDATIAGRLVADGGPPNGMMVRAGPGADTACGADAPDPGDPSTGDGGGGGGGGGGYGNTGGDGGDGQGMDHGGKGSKGALFGVLELSPLHGGCSGGGGGNAGVPGGGTGGAGGGGGGAIQVIARDSLTVTGTVTAAGGGGDGGKTGAGGGRAGAGGGGSGGTIFLETDVLDIASGAFVCANGGSGGEGSSQTTAGANGNRGTCSRTMGAITVNVEPNGGDGGDGGYRDSAKGTNGSNGAMESGGGGGGGGVGRIRFHGVTSDTVSGTSTVSPAAYRN